MVPSRHRLYYSCRPLFTLVSVFRHQTDESCEDCSITPLVEARPTGQAVEVISAHDVKNLNPSWENGHPQVLRHPIFGDALAGLPVGLNLGARGGRRRHTAMGRFIRRTGCQHLHKNKGHTLEVVRDMLVLHVLHDYLCRLRRHRSSEHRRDDHGDHHDHRLRSLLGYCSRPGLRHRHSVGHRGTGLPISDGRVERDDGGSSALRRYATAAPGVFLLAQVRAATRATPRRHFGHESRASGRGSDANKQKVAGEGQPLQVHHAPRPPASWKHHLQGLRGGRLAADGDCVPRAVRILRNSPRLVHPQSWFSRLQVQNMPVGICLG
mmetsp:Transcript_7215/g.16394  ORF Transcript_7215/g.16394 Transcript_7215/m.16394 type:complete len:323 (+) Transcript_7215:186-1154(+)